MKILKGVLGAVLVGAVIATSATASSATDDYDINVTVDPYCEIYSLTDITLSYNPFNPAVSNTFANFSFACVKGTTFTISATSANGGELVSDTTSDTLPYTLAASVVYPSVSASEGNILNNSLTMTAPTKNPPTAAIRIVNIPFNQNIAPGTYTDTVTLNITY
ncbi:Spore Coat Protein U domain-containing protein [Persephonella hydrogeniphila]|uniref:Spore Coat Protein U domain-containing protein n=1 Tax=Persephonella hydrogeniphila TaxID=198703 RepID=A0A285NJ91_9AQUI|nr:spore coat protein U domain-containing protein [Persephonella hydrogeniphila]SNZ07926.1 Spore Coat Protein U domain-containing protein [Persephonella hydrogeniphila]